MIDPEEILQHALTFYREGYLAEAEELCLSIVQSAPMHAAANYLLGLMMLTQARADLALPHLQIAWEAEPTEGEYWLTLTECLLALGYFEDAQGIIEEAIRRGMDTPQLQQLRLFAKRGKGRISPPTAIVEDVLALFRGGRYAELELRAKPLLQEYPGWVLGWSALGAARNHLGMDSESALRRALALDPQSAETHNNLGGFLRTRGRLDEGLIYLRQAVQLAPKYAEAHYNLGTTMQDADRYDEAISSYRKAIKINPAFLDAQAALGVALASRGKVAEALDVLRQLLRVKPDHLEARGHLLFTLAQCGDIDAETLFAEHLRFGEIFETPLRSSWQPFSNTRDPERSLRVGLISADFFHHAVANFLAPILPHLARSELLSLHAYYNHTLVDNVTLQLKQYFTQWNQVSGLSDAELATKIREDGIDILIDLSGHTGRNRLLVFARKPAPIQVSWIGYPCTTGLRAIDYYLTDRFFLPPNLFEDQFTEKIVRLPASVPFLPADKAPPINALPLLENGQVTFGSFNRPSKIGRSVVALWSRLLRGLPESKMLLGAMPKDGGYGELIDWFAQEGIARERLDFYERSGMDNYLQLHHKVDICLDTFPYNGGTTTFHALWMGVPTLTLAGRTPAGRSGASILGNLDLEGFVARDEADFVQKGMSWANHPAELSELRAGLRERFAQSASGKPAVVAQGFENAMRAIWRRWCSGLPPVSFDVE